MSLSSAKAKLDAQGGDPVTGYISKTDHQESYDELVDDTALTGATTAEALDVTGALTAGTIASDATVAGTGLAGGLLSAATPVINGTAAAGTSAVPSRDDHVHASDTTKVTGPASATDNALVRFDATTGKLVQNSGVIVDDSNNVTGLGTVASGAVTSSAAVQAAAASGFVIGSSGPKLLSGTGSPEGVVPAPVGSQWTDTAATTGAIRWIKATGTGNTGWVVEYGDTGSRSLTATDTPHANTTVTTLAVRRVGSFVTLSFYLNQTGAVPETKIYDALPSGFRPGLQVTSIQNRGGVLSLADTITFDARANGQLYYAISAASTFTGQVTWFTPDAWPVTLP